MMIGVRVGGHSAMEIGGEGEGGANGSRLWL